MLANSPAPSFVLALFTKAGRAVVSAFYGVHSLAGTHISGGPGNLQCVLLFA